MSRFLYSSIFVLCLLPILNAALTSPVTLADRLASDGWRNGAGCVMKDDNIAIMLLLPPNNAAQRTSVSIWSVLVNRDGSSRAQTTAPLSATDYNQLSNNVAIVCLSSGGYAIITQVGTAVTLSFFNSMGVVTQTLTRTAFYGDASLGATSDGGFCVGGLSNNGGNSVEVYNADGTLRSTIALGDYPDYSTTVTRGADGSIIVALTKSGSAVTLKFFDLDGKSTGSDMAITVSGNAKLPLTATLTDKKLAALEKSVDSQNILSITPTIYGTDLALFKKLTTQVNAEVDRYNLVALQDGGFAVSWKTQSTRNGYWQIFNGDGTERTPANLVDVKGGPYILGFGDGSLLAVTYEETSTNQHIEGYRIDPKGNQITFGANCDACPQAPAKSYFVGTMTYSMPFDQFVSSNGEKAFIQQLMKVLNLKVEQIEIISVTSGSTIINFKIVDNKADSAAPSISTIKSNLDAAVKNNQMTVLNSQVASYVSSDPVIASASKLQMALAALFLVFIALFN